MPDLVFKRSFDIVLAALGLVLTLPLWLIFVAWIWMEDRGPVFFRQVRIGRYGKPFTVLKFRSMVHDPSTVEVQARRNDPRITRVGQLLRRTSLDELPQLWNILVGDMSLVGPRAQPEKEIVRTGTGELELYIRDVPGFALRQVIRPGLTGIAQIYAPREIPHRQKFRYDLIYVKRILKARPRTFLAALIDDARLLCLDIRLVLQSVGMAFRGKWEV